MTVPIILASSYATTVPTFLNFKPNPQLGQSVILTCRMPYIENQPRRMAWEFPQNLVSIKKIC